MEKNIQLDLNVLTKILKKKNPKEKDFHFEVVKVMGDGQKHAINEVIKESPKPVAQLQQEQNQQLTAQKMMDLKQKIENNSHRAHLIEKEKAATAKLHEELLQKAKLEKETRQKMMEKAAEMAKQTLLAKEKLRKETEIAAKEKEQKVKDFQKKLEDEAQALIAKKEALAKQVEDAKKAQEFVEKIKKAEAEEKQKLEEEKALRMQLDKQEDEKQGQDV